MSDTISQLLGHLGSLDGLLHAVDPRELDRAIEEVEARARALQHLRTLQSLHRREAEAARPAPPVIPLATIATDPAQVRSACRDETPPARLSNVTQSRLNRLAIAEYLRQHEPATAAEIASGANVAEASCGVHLRDSSFVRHDDQIPRRYRLAAPAPQTAEAS